jgi:hypothetical protein
LTFAAHATRHLLTYFFTRRAFICAADNADSSGEKERGETAFHPLKVKVRICIARK